MSPLRVLFLLLLLLLQPQLLSEESRTTSGLKEHTEVKDDVGFNLTSADEEPVSASSSRSNMRNQSSKGCYKDFDRPEMCHPCRSCENRIILIDSVMMGEAMARSHWQ